MISHRHKCIFIHIPKCAGTSIESLLSHHDRYSGRCKQDHRSMSDIQKKIPSGRMFSRREAISRGTVRLHNLVRQLRGDCKLNVNNVNIVTRSQYNEYFKFCFIRNPWSRAFSWYRNVMRDEIHRTSMEIGCDTGLDEFLAQEMGKGVLEPQTFWIKDNFGKIPLDFIGKFEHLIHDFKIVARELQISCDLPHDIRGDNLDYRAAYSSQAKDAVWRFYREEIQMFGYEFDS